MSHYSKKILEEAQKREEQGIEYFPGDADPRNIDDLIRIAVYFNKEYNGATSAKILEVLDDNVVTDNIQKALLFLFLGNENQAESYINSEKDSFDYFDNILQYVTHPEVNQEIISFLIPKTLESYKKLRFHDSSFFKQYAKNQLLEEPLLLSDTDKISLIKELARVDDIRGKAVSIDEIEIDSIVVEALLEELEVKINKKGNKLKSIMSIDNPVEQDVVLKDKTICWELENKTIRKINDWISRAKEVILTTSLNTMSNPTARKLAVGALVVGVALGSNDAMADMTDAAQNLTDLGDMLADKIGNIEGTGSCNIGTEIFDKSANHVQGRLTLGDYVVDFNGSGYDAGVSKASDISVKIGRLKAESDCILDVEDARKMAKTVRKIIAKQ